MAAFNCFPGIYFAGFRHQMMSHVNPEDGDLPERFNVFMGVVNSACPTLHINKRYGEGLAQ